MRKDDKILDCDFLIIGAGIIGMSLAREILTVYPEKSIAIIEKEPDTALHGSGRNSGVLHAGFYYTADSLKSRFTRQGNDELTGYCVDNNLKINRCMKAVVASGESELESLFVLEKRGRASGVDVSIISANELKGIDKNAKTFQYALLSPSTSTVDPVEVCGFMKRELIEKGVAFYFNNPYIKRINKNTIMTKECLFRYDVLVNAAGLYADKIAGDFGLSKDYVIIPFKGTYLKYTGKKKPVTINVYPVPDLKNPFLGVHYTVSVDGTVKIGPTAVPALWRENYQGLDNLRVNEMIKVLYYGALLFYRNSFGFRDLACGEIKEYNKNFFVSMAGRIVHDLDPRGFTEWTRPGIRAQLLNVNTFELVQDFIIEKNDNTVHILNAVSPAFTSSFPFARWVVSEYIGSII